MSDGPLEEIAAECERLIAGGGTVFQKFTCEACLARQVMAEPNVLYTSGKCDECGHVTDIQLRGCGFMYVASGDPEKHQEFVEVIKDSISKSQPRNRN